jgi:hypothetical protein
VSREQWSDGERTDQKTVLVDFGRIEKCRLLVCVDTVESK